MKYFQNYIILLNLLIDYNLVNCFINGRAKSLYDQSNQILILNNENIKSILKKKYAHLIEFYASWCGHCECI